MDFVDFFSGRFVDLYVDFVDIFMDFVDLFVGLFLPEICGSFGGFRGKLD